MASKPQPKNIQVVQPKTAASIWGRLLSKIDNIQLNNHRLGFIYAVLKKYGDDEGGNQAALVTYYGFLSLFPLLVAALSLTELSIFRSTHLKSKVITALNNYFPLVGHQLENNVHSQSKEGLALGVSLLITIYGAKGVAAALRQAMNHIWQVPRAERSSWPKGTIRSLLVILTGGVGFIITGILSSYATGKGGNIGLQIAAMLLSLILTFVALIIVFKLSISRATEARFLVVGSIVAAIGLQIVQAAGGFLITHELKHFSSLYGSLALVFVILFWIYLQVRILFYATEIDSVRKFGLWPRSLTGFRLTAADRKALKLYAKREAMVKPPAEEVNVNFKGRSIKD